MATPDTTILISNQAQERIVKMLNTLIDNENGMHTLRPMLLERDRAYYREQDKTTEQARAKAANKTGDAKKLQNPTVPVVAPQVETGLAYLSDIFLSSYPIFPVVSGPKLIDAALEIETVLGESAVHFQWARHFAMALRDGLKYNLQAAEVEWESEKVYSVENDASKDIVFGVPTETTFEGNKIRRLDLYNFICDKRVAPSEIHTKGDFAGYSELISRIQLKQEFLNLDTTLTMNATTAFESTGGALVKDGATSSYYVPEVNPEAFLQPTYSGTNWMQWANLETAKKINYQDMYEKTVMYVRVIPRELGINVKNAGVPQIFKFIMVNRRVLIFAQRKTNAHNFLPIVVGQPIEDGLGYQTKSYADTAAPYQQIASALYAAGMASQRRKVYDRIFYDPSRINKSDIDKVDPVARIPIKSEAYGKPLSEAFAVAPYNDNGVGDILQIAREVVDMADVATGQNRVQRGQFQKGNKTRYEFSEVMQNSDARPRLIALMLEVGWFQPIKHILKSNILQYQPPTKLYNRQEKKEVEVNPAELRKQIWQFQIADGIMPVDKLVNLETFGQAFQFAAAVPAAAAEYDLLGMYIYQLKLQGARWVDDFKRDQAGKEEFLNSQAQVNGQQPTPPTAPVA